MKNLRLLAAVVALIVVGVIAGTVIGSARAAAPAGAPAAAAAPASETNAPAASEKPGIDKQAYCESFLQHFAANLGVDSSKLVGAARDAAKATLDEAVKAGDLTQAQADRISEHLTQAVGDKPCAALGSGVGGLKHPGGPGRDGFGHWRHGFGFGGFGLGGFGFGAFGLGDEFRGAIAEVATATADSLHLSNAKLLERVRGGETLKQIAAAQGVDYAAVTKAAADATKTALDKLVKDGKLPQALADQLLSQAKSWLADGGDIRSGIGGAFGPGFAPGKGMRWLHGGGDAPHR